MPVSIRLVSWSTRWLSEKTRSFSDFRKLRVWWAFSKRWANSLRETTSASEYGAPPSA
jgi:hypothetical protein